MLTRAGIALLMTVAVLMTAAPPSYADGCPTGTTATPGPGGGVICITATDPGSSSSDGDETSPVSDDSHGCTRADGTETACVNEWGVWMPAHQCYAHEVHVPPSHEAWNGHTEGAVWMCALLGDSAPPTLFWMPPGASPGPLPDPGELAQTAVDQLRLETAQLQTAPQDPERSIVGVEVWMWVPESQWRTLTETVTAGDTSVTVIAEPDHVVWEMGQGTRTCYSAGREWRSGMSEAAVTGCGFTYTDTSADEPGGVFALSARIAYQVDWTCSGACTTASGSLGLVEAPAGNGRLGVLQRQTVVVG